MQKEKIEKFKFTDSLSLIKEIEKDLYNFCLRLQNYSKSNSIHNICVKAFLEKGKTILALKSLLYLKNNYESSQEYYEASISFNDYLNLNKERINEEDLELIKAKIGINQNKLENKEKSLNSLIFKIKQNLRKNEKLNEKISYDDLNSLDIIQSRNIKSDELIIFETLIKLFLKENEEEIVYNLLNFSHDLMKKLK